MDEYPVPPLVGFEGDDCIPNHRWRNNGPYVPESQRWEWVQIVDTLLSVPSWSTHHPSRRRTIPRGATITDEAKEDVFWDDTPPDPTASSSSAAYNQPAVATVSEDRQRTQSSTGSIRSRPPFGSRSSSQATNSTVSAVAASGPPQRSGLPITLKSAGPLKSLYLIEYSSWHQGLSRAGRRSLTLENWFFLGIRKISSL